MSILPVKMMSPLDKANNFMKIIEGKTPRRVYMQPKIEVHKNADFLFKDKTKSIFKFADKINEYMFNNADRILKSMNW